MREALGAFCQGVFLGLVLVGAALASLFLAGDPGMPGLNIRQDFYTATPVPTMPSPPAPTSTPTPRPTRVPEPSPTPGVRPNGHIPGFSDPHTGEEKLYFETEIGRIR